jgi:ketosteroid isomerase-like protein
MNCDDALRFAEQWVANWNARDLTAVLAHFEDGVALTSPRALAVAGVATVHGKPAWRDYWARALASIDSLRFGRRDRAAEVLQLGSSGRVARAEVYHGLLP